MISPASGSGFVTPDGWVRVDAWAGRSLNHLPLAVREREEPLTHCDSIVEVVHDPACDPRSGGIAGSAHLAARCGVGVQQFRTRLLPALDFVRDLHGIPVTHVASIDAWAAAYRARLRRERLARLGMEEDGEG